MFNCVIKAVWFRFKERITSCKKFHIRLINVVSSHGVRAHPLGRNDDVTDAPVTE